MTTSLFTLHRGFMLDKVEHLRTQVQEVEKKSERWKVSPNYIKELKKLSVS